jgi:fatty acid amide hydrolase 2
MSLSPTLTLSATELARKIRSRELTSREIVEAHIERIRCVNPTVNAVVADRFDEARREADDADRRVAAGEDDLPPLHGVPCTIKECFRLSGMPNTAGLVARKGLVADGDAVGVARLRAAGAIPLGVTNTSELCMWYETNNRVYGRTNNPYDPRRIVGGSSGGEGAIVAAGGSPFGLGSDVGGSIRMPAFFNGVFGHKPSAGLIPSSGQYPVVHGVGWRYLGTGPIARRAEDLAAVVKVLAGPDPTGEDTSTESMSIGDPSAVELSSLTVLDVEGDGATQVSDELRTAQRRCAAHLAARGARIVHTTIDGLGRVFDMWSASMSAAAKTPFGTLLGNGVPVRAGQQLLRWTVRRSPHTLPAIALSVLESLSARLPSREQKGLALARELKRRFDDLVGAHTVLLYPSHPTTAPLHYVPLLRPFRFVYTAIFNVLELPVTQVPLGLDRAGLPLGVQVAARRGNDHVTLAVAMELEKAFGGWVPPPT